MALPVPPVVTAPNVGPEPKGLMDAVKQKIFGQPGPAAPDPYALTNQQAVDLLKETREFCEPGRELFEYGWWRNLLYLLNRQWIFWNPTSRQWVDKRLAKWVPKPVTNIIRTAVLSIRSMAQSVDHGVSVTPNGKDAKNITTAETSDNLEPVIAQEHKRDSWSPDADYWAIILGNAYLYVFWDKSDVSNSATVDLWTCQMCKQESPSDDVAKAGQKCPACGSSALMKTGQETLPIGKGKTLVVSPLELLLPLYAQSWEAVDRLVFLTWRPKHDLEGEYGDLQDEDGKPLLDKLNYGTGPTQRSLQLYRALATTSDLQVSPSSFNTGNSFTGQIKGATEQHLWIKPCKKYPRGFYMRFLGESAPLCVRTLDDQGQPQLPEIPFVTVTGKPIWPWVHYAYEKISGRLYAQSAIDVIIEKQDQLNKIDSMTQMVAQRMGNPIWREEKGQEVERFTGEPGLIVRWQRTGPNSQPPDRVSGENPPQSFFTMRDQYKEDAQELAGTTDVLKGTKPAGVEAFSALQLIVQISQSRFKNFFNAREEYYRDWYTIALELERKYGPTSRVRALMGPNQSWTFKTFAKADLSGDVTIGVAGNQPKTALGRRAAIEHANQLGLINHQDTEQQHELYKELGITNLAPSLDADVNACLQEQQAFEDWASQFPTVSTPPPLKRMPWHNDRVHLTENRKWMNGDFVRDLIARLPPPAAAMIVEVLNQHLLEHAQALAPIGAMGTDPNAPGPGPSPAPGAPAGPGAGPNPPSGGASKPASPAGRDGGGVGAGRAMHSSNSQLNHSVGASGSA